MDDRLAPAARTLAVLGDDLRRRIYLFIRGEGAPATREEVARELGISRKLAAFHLDKLAAAGLLETHFARPAGRSGPGAGRTAKYYGPSDVELQVSVPERRYERLGRFLLDALRPQGTEDTRPAAVEVARRHGVRVGREVRERSRVGRMGAERALAIAGEVLEEQGFEPVRSGAGELSLRNCPYHALAQLAPELVCVMNQAFIAGLVGALGSQRLDVALEPAPGRCCVVLRVPRRGEEPSPNPTPRGEG